MFPAPFSSTNGARDGSEVGKSTEGVKVRDAVRWGQTLRDYAQRLKDAVQRPVASYALPNLQIFDRHRVEALVLSTLGWLDHIVKTLAPAIASQPLPFAAVFDIDDTLVYRAPGPGGAAVATLHPYATHLYSWCVAHGISVVLVSARPDAPLVRKRTEATLRALGIRHDALYLMPLGLFPPGTHSPTNLPYLHGKSVPDIRCKTDRPDSVQLAKRDEITAPDEQPGAQTIEKTSWQQRRALEGAICTFKSAGAGG